MKYKDPRPRSLLNLKYRSESTSSKLPKGKVSSCERKKQRDKHERGNSDIREWVGVGELLFQSPTCILKRKRGHG